MSTGHRGRGAMLLSPLTTEPLTRFTMSVTFGPDLCGGTSGHHNSNKRLTGCISVQPLIYMLRLIVAWQIYGHR